jgi:hypothetical protein
VSQYGRSGVSSFNHLKIPRFMPRWCFKCVLPRAKVRKLFRITAFIRRRRSLCSHENRLWSREKRFDRSQKWQDEFETHSENLTEMEAQSSTGLPNFSMALTLHNGRGYPPIFLIGFAAVIATWFHIAPATSRSCWYPPLEGLLVSRISCIASISMRPVV